MFNKIIDFHTHIFPEDIAQKAVNHVGDYYGYKMEGNGKIEQLDDMAKGLGIANYVIHSSATRASQVENVNDFIATHTKKYNKAIGFGTIHHEHGDISGEIKRMQAIGLKGIKLHPDFQRFDIDSPLMYPIYEAAQGKLPVLFHVGDEVSDSSSPRRLRRIMDSFPRLVVIAAHLGGYCAWDEAAQYLHGTRAYLDTSSIFPKLTKEQAKKIILTHGVDRVVFGSDYPLKLTSAAIEEFLQIGLNDEFNKKILYENAIALLNL